MRAGRLDKYVTIQKKTISQNSMGEWVDSYSTFAQVWASIEPLRGNEYFSAQQVNSDIEGKIIIRYLAEIQPGCRVTCEGRTYEILSIVNPYEGKRELQLMYRERVN